MEKICKAFKKILFFKFSGVRACVTVAVGVLFGNVIVTLVQIVIDVLFVVNDAVVCQTGDIVDRYANVVVDAVDLKRRRSGRHSAFGLCHRCESADIRVSYGEVDLGTLAVCCDVRVVRRRAVLENIINTDIVEAVGVSYDRTDRCHQEYDHGDKCDFFKSLVTVFF